MFIQDCKTEKIRKGTAAEVAEVEALLEADRNRPPVEPERFVFPPREFLAALVAEGVLTQAKAVRVLERLRR